MMLLDKKPIKAPGAHTSLQFCINQIKMLTLERIFWIFVFFALARASLSDEEVSCAGGEEFIPHENCSLFYHCSNGVPILQYCPDGYYFNTRLDICDFPQNVPECQGGTRPPPVPTTAIPSSTTSRLTTTTQNATTPDDLTTTEDIPTSPSPIPERECGQVINETSGYISYKLNTQYQHYERCIWTISVPGATKYRFILQQSGMEDRYDGILLSGLSRNDDIDIESQQINGTQKIYEVIGNTAIVLFFSDSTVQGTGFLLSFAVELDQNQSPGYSENHIFNILRHEEVEYVRGGGESTYENNELTTIVHVGPLPSNLTSSYRGSLGSCDQDYILHYMLENSNYPSMRWRYRQRLCSSPINWHDNEHTDATMYVFKSDETEVHSGFTFRLATLP